MFDGILNTSLILLQIVTEFPTNRVNSHYQKWGFVSHKSMLLLKFVEILLHVEADVTNSDSFAKQSQH